MADNKDKESKGAGQVKPASPDAEPQPARFAELGLNKGQNEPSELAFLRQRLADLEARQPRTQQEIMRINAAQMAEAQASNRGETVPGGRYRVGDQEVDAEGRPFNSKESKAFRASLGAPDEEEDK